MDLSKIDLLAPEAKQDILALLDKIDRAKKEEAARSSFLSFIKYMWPDFIEGYHHKIIADLFDDVLSGKKKRVIINLGPRHTKSEFSSVFLPAYYLGRFPNKKIIQTSHTAELSVGFGRKVKNIVAGSLYKDIFPDVDLAADSKAAGRWATNKGGEYFAIGVGGALAGRGADLLVIDDPHSEQDAILGEGNPEIYNKVMEWYEGGPRQRLQPGGAIIVVMTRWSLRDLTGQLLRKQQTHPDTDQWEVVELPAIMPSGKPLWPEYWKLEELLKTKNSIPVSKWNAQYMQQPTAEEGALIKREWWKNWTKKEPPECAAIIQSWDTAFSKGTRANYSACTTWGVYYDEDNKGNLVLLDAIRGKWEFPDLKQKAKEHYIQWNPDICLIESRAAGMPLIYEFRQAGIPVQDVSNSRGTRFQPNDKISRVNGITDIFVSGNVWAPTDRQWAQEVIEECASFPAGEYDDFVDTVVMALTRFRHGGWIGMRSDSDESGSFYRRKISYY